MLVFDEVVLPDKALSPALVTVKVKLYVPAVGIEIDCDEDEEDILVDPVAVPVQDKVAVAAGSSAVKVATTETFLTPPVTVNVVIEGSLYLILLPILSGPVIVIPPKVVELL